MCGLFGKWLLQGIHKSMEGLEIAVLSEANRLFYPMVSRDQDGIGLLHHRHIDLSLAPVV